LGNPPFGHQGETAIQRWFSRNSKQFDTPPKMGDPEGFQPVPEEHRKDFLEFEGNAQSMRLLTCLQNTSGSAGLNLTAATLAALMKYTVRSGKTDKTKKVKAASKFGFFDSETETVDWIRHETGLADG